MGHCFLPENLPFWCIWLTANVDWLLCLWYHVWRCLFLRLVEFIFSFEYRNKKWVTLSRLTCLPISIRDGNWDFNYACRSSDFLPPNQATLSRHSFLGPNGLKSQWVAPSRIKVENADLCYPLIFLVFIFPCWSNPMLIWV